MRLESLEVRYFRSYATEQLRIGPALTVLVGPNGAGKTNLLEALYFGCTGRSCRTSNERELVRFGAKTTRVEVALEDADGPHRLAVGFTPGQPKRMSVDGAAVERIADSPHRPLVSVFLPDRLELIKGTPALRRAHLDQVVAAMWPARAVNRRVYAQVLAQRNALITRIRAGFASLDQLTGWDLQLARAGVLLMGDRAQVCSLLAARFEEAGASLGLGPCSEVSLTYRPRSKAEDVDGLLAELQDRRESDVERGFSAHGPHRDDISLRLSQRELRSYGSQGQQRLALLSLLLAERQALSEHAGRRPVMLLDDVMSELDPQRRRLLIALLERQGGQAVLTATEAEAVPPGQRDDTLVVGVAEAALSYPRVPV